MIVAYLCRRNMQEPLTGLHGTSWKTEKLQAKQILYLL